MSREAKTEKPPAPFLGAPFGGFVSRAEVQTAETPPRIPQVGDTVHLFYQDSFIGDGSRTFSTPARVTRVHHPGCPNSILDLSVEDVILHENCQPAERGDFGSYRLRGKWALLDPEDEEDERVLKDPPDYDDKPGMGNARVVLFLPDGKGRDQPRRVKVVNDHSGERNYHLDLAEVRDREEVGVTYGGDSKFKDRTWDWEPSPLNAEREEQPCREP